MPEHTERADLADLFAYALAKPGAWRDEPWEGDVVVKVADKVFLFVGALDADPPHSIGVKCGRNRDEADSWLAEFPDDATVSAYIGRYGWNVLNLAGAIADDVLREAIDASYDAVVAKLPKAKRP